MRADAFDQAVERGFAHLSRHERERIRNDLRAHLLELPDDEALVVAQDPDEYVREIRDAWGLDPAPLTSRRRSPTWTLTAALIVTVALVAGSVAAFVARVGAGSADKKHTIVVPNLYGQSQDAAREQLTQLQFRVRVIAQESAKAPGRVLAQDPIEGDAAPVGSVVALHISVPKGGALLPTYPTGQIPPVLVEQLKVGRKTIAAFAATQLAGVSRRQITLAGVPLSGFFGFPDHGLCLGVFIADPPPSGYGAIGGGGGRCDDPRLLPRISVDMSDNYWAGMTSAAASEVRVSWPGRSAPITTPTVTNPAFPGLRFFLTPIWPIRYGSVITFQAVSARGAIVATTKFQT